MIPTIRPGVAVVVALRVGRRRRGGRAASACTALIASTGAGCSLFSPGSTQRVTSPLSQVSSALKSTVFVPLGIVPSSTGNLPSPSTCRCWSTRSSRRPGRRRFLVTAAVQPVTGVGRGRGQRRRGREVELDARELAVVRALVLGRDGRRHDAVGSARRRPRSRRARRRRAGTGRAPPRTRRARPWTCGSWSDAPLVALTDGSIGGSADGDVGRSRSRRRAGWDRP